MKKIIITAVFGGMLSLLMAEKMAEKITNKGDGFFKINDNIQNEELRAELEILKSEFNMERQKIHVYYQEQMETLKQSRKKEVRAIKDTFSERRKGLMKKYMGKMRDKSGDDAPKKMLNKPNKVKASKEKMKKRKY
tara:strand:+ start:435 stop:842 length:408 start_codon:yes stop_codon:yes gene_type:complete